MPNANELDQARTIATLTERIALLTNKVEKLEGQVTTKVEKLEVVLTTKVEKLEGGQAEFQKMLERWRGGFIVIVAIGSMLGYAFTMWDKVASRWH